MNKDRRIYRDGEYNSRGNTIRLGSTALQPIKCAAVLEKVQIESKSVTKYLFHGRGIHGTWRKKDSSDSSNRLLLHYISSKCLLNFFSQVILPIFFYNHKGIFNRITKVLRKSSKLPSKYLLKSNNSSK